MSEVNPNHPVTQRARENWHKICALIMDKIGASEVVITPDEIESFSRSERVIVVRYGDCLTVSLVDEAEGRRLAREEGGLPM